MLILPVGRVGGNMLIFLFKIAQNSSQKPEKFHVIYRREIKNISVIGFVLRELCHFHIHIGLRLNFPPIKRPPFHVCD